MATRALEMVGSNRFCKSRKTDSSRTSGTFKMLHIVVPIVPGQESPLASGMAPAREAESAGAVPEVPKGR